MTQANSMRSHTFQLPRVLCAYRALAEALNAQKMLCFLQFLWSPKYLVQVREDWLKKYDKQVSENLDYFSSGMYLCIAIAHS